MKRLRLLSRYKRAMWQLLMYMLDKEWQDESKDDHKEKETFLNRYRGKSGFLGRVVLVLDRLWLKERVISVLRITKEDHTQ